ncbi:MAG: SPOR domain-containing protein, partial [Desulfobacteraceae bacterium]|nr:SPOR domain-containing protein [Desulfobacteraceae bacterium]
ENGSSSEDIGNKTNTQIAFKQSQKSLTKGKYSASKQNKKTSELREIVKPVKPFSTPKKKVDKKAKGKYTIQIAAFQDINGAIQKISSLKAKGYAGYKTKGKVQDQVWHRVRVGHFSDTEVARKYLRKLKQDNINGIIIKQD